MFTSIFFFIVPYSTGISTLSLHDALPISALLGHAGPDHPLPGLRRRAGAREGLAGEAARGPGARRHRQPARQDAGVLRDEVPGVRKAGEARDRYDGHVRRFVVVLRTLHLPASG